MDFGPDMSERLTIYEVGPRDGLQNEAKSFTTDQKLYLIDSLVAAGIRNIELTSFVHPRAVPQMADADEVMRRTLLVCGRPYLRFTGLVFNQKGFDRAVSSGCRALAFGVSVTDTFSERNTGMSSSKLLQLTADLVKQAKTHGLWTRVYISAAWICPFEGPVAVQRTLATAARVSDMQADEIAIADTIGYANPLEVGRLIDQLARILDIHHLAVHLHDTQALGLANATTAMQAGVRIFDTSIGGLGGCPFAPGAAGNLATEDLVFMAYKMGFGTGIDFDKLWSIVNQLEEWIGRPIGGRIRPWWESMCRTEPPIAFN